MPYVEAIGRELELTHSLPIGGGFACKAEKGPCTEFSTLYLGGGTPSQLSVEALQRLFFLVGRHATLAPAAEVTIEANPDDVTPQWVDALRDTPVNRISMGVQSFDDGILRTLRRRHTAEQAQRAVRLLQYAGYTNLSLDLIYGLPGQSLTQFEDDVRQALALDIRHLSAYALQFEAGTPLFSMREQGLVAEADEELSLACYESLINLTAEASMEHYEISNFARPGFRSRHNSSYWTGQPYIGLGAGAHSYYPAPLSSPTPPLSSPVPSSLSPVPSFSSPTPSSCVRSFNCEDVKAYIRSINEGQRPATIEALSPTDLYNERIMLRLRTCEGLSLSELGRDFGLDLRQYCERMAAPHIQRERLQKKAGETLCLTRNGLFVSDDIISDLMTV